MDTNRLLSIGKILNFRGLKGEAKVGFTKGLEEKIKSLNEVWVKGEKLEVEGVRFHKQFALIKFKNINSIEELMPYKGENIYISKDDMEKSLKEDEFLVSDLVGISVIDSNDDIMGYVKSVGNNGANDILCVVNENLSQEFLVPFVKELVPVVDIKNKKIVVKLIDGLVNNEI